MQGIHHSAIRTSDVDRSLRFWCDGPGRSQLLDHHFIGDRPESSGAKSDQVCSILPSHPRTPDSGIVEPAEVPDSDVATPAPAPPGHGFFLLSSQRDVDETLSALGALGFDDGVQHTAVADPGGNSVTMAVITAPAGMLVGLIGSAQ